MDESLKELTPLLDEKWDLAAEYQPEGKVPSVEEMERMLAAERIKAAGGR
jgi:hypothetical protein